jgi:antitoxin StbD
MSENLERKINPRRNEPAFYSVPAKEYETLMNRLEDLELLALCKEREDDPTVKVSIDDL